jgi:hypothetical protein
MKNKGQQDENKTVENGRIKGTSAFDIHQAKRVNEISWSNNKFESTYSTENNDKSAEE